jgi:anti-sigma regulatory factor (Ser/Thr protein kinase)
MKSLQPPYLLTASTDRRGLSVGVVADASTAVVEMTVHGSWSQQLGRQVAASIRLCLAGPSASVIIDLHDLQDPYGVSLPFWLSVWREGGLGPAPVQLALCVPATTVLDSRLRQPAVQPLVFPTMSEARMAIADRLSRAHRLQARLAPRPASVRAARDLVAQACQAWRLPQLQDAWLVVSELVANAVEHARTEFVITASTRGDTRLHLAVRDGTTNLPRLRETSSSSRPGLLQERGRGLWLVHASAAAWGAMPARGGKVVWATVSPDQGAEVGHPYGHSP